MDIIVGPPCPNSTGAGLWFTEVHGAALGCITTSGTVTENHIGRGCLGIAIGPDGNIWFTEQSNNLIGGLPPP